MCNVRVCKVIVKSWEYKKTSTSCRQTMDKSVVWSEVLIQTVGLLLSALNERDPVRVDSCICHLSNYWAIIGPVRAGSFTTDNKLVISVGAALWERLYLDTHQSCLYILSSPSCCFFPSSPFLPVLSGDRSINFGQTSGETGMRSIRLTLNFL